MCFNCYQTWGVVLFIWQQWNVFFCYAIMYFFVCVFGGGAGGTRGCQTFLVSVFPNHLSPPATLTLLYFYIWEIHIHAFPNLFMYAKFLFCRVCVDEFHRTSPCIFIGVKFALFFSFCHVWKRCQKKLSLSPAQKFNFSQFFCIFLLLFCSSFPGCPNSKLQNNFQVRAGKLLLKD